MGLLPFDPEVLKAMGFAFDDACRKLDLADRTDAATEIIASIIIDQARLGHRDPARLCDAVLEICKSPR